MLLILRLKQANSATKVDIADFVKKADFDKKPISINKKITSNKTKHLDAEKKLTDMKKKIAQISEKGHHFLLGRMYFTGDDIYQNFLIFMLMASSLKLDNNKKFNN